MFTSLLFVTSLSFQVNGFLSPDVKPVQAPNNLTVEMRGDILMAKKMYREAIEMYKTGPADSAVLANKIGIGYHQLLDYENASKWYARAVKLNPKYPEAINNLGTIYYARKSYRRSISEYKRALHITPQSAPILSNLGTSYFARKNYELAFTTYQQALALDPDVFEHRSAMGVLLEQRSVVERAKYHYFLAKTYAKAGDVDHALLYIRKSLEEGFKERDKFSKEPEFAAVRENPEFTKIISAEQKVL